VARIRPFRGPGAFGLALAAWDIWRRIPPHHRKLIVRQARTHGPRIASKLLDAQQQRRRRR
jgi:hypothetical protein